MSDIKDDEKEILLDHDYDNIQELDNPLPKWWLLTFYGTIIFSVFYYAYYELGSGPSLSEELREDMQVVEAKMREADRKAEANIDWQALAKDPEALAVGKSIYDKNCASCHAAQGQGLIGPNLADNYWIHGDGSMPEIAKILKKGVLEKGMPPWQEILKPEELQATTAYVYNMIGTNPPNPKAPQGEKIEL
tara:strand:- start:6122 stop:6694 length:573 start_codon:yes stop_codon:yes gene_type:complete